MPKEKDSVTQFSQICLLNVEGKIFFGVMAQRLSTLLLSNFITTTVQKAGTCVFSGCLEHASII